MTAGLADGRRARDAGMAAAESRRAAEQDKAVIDAAIEYLAGTGEEFSANDVRPLLPSVAGSLIGTRFLAASRSGLIERAGTTQADHEEGHARLLSTWRRASGSSLPAGSTVPHGSRLPAGGVQPIAPRVSPEAEQAMRRAECALAGGRGATGLRNTTEARALIRQLLDALTDATGAEPASTDSLF
jgi:hypothetical protein